MAALGVAEGVARTGAEAGVLGASVMAVDHVLSAAAIDAALEA